MNEYRNPTRTVLRPLHIAVRAVSIVLLLGPRVGPQSELSAFCVGIYGYMDIWIYDVHHFVLALL